MKIMRILGVAVLAATVAGCTLSERQFVEYRAVFNKHPELRARYHVICVKEIKRSPRAKIELAAEVVDLKVSTFPQAFCKRMLSAYLSGRLTYADYKDLSRSKPTPRLIRILRGK